MKVSTRSSGVPDGGSEVDASSSLEPADSPKHSELPSSRTWAGFVRTLVVSASILASLTVVAAGVGVIAFVILARTVAPAVAHLSKELYFDYSETTAVATVSLLDATALKGKDGITRAFRPGQQLSVWLELEAAEASRNVNTDVFQVLAQLIATDSKPAATASRPCLVPQYWIVRQWIRNLAATPFVLLGWWPEGEIVRVPLFSRYTEQLAKPFVGFRAVLKVVSRDGSLPHIYGAKVHVNLALGWAGRLLYWARPGWAALPLVCLGLCLIGGGSLTMLFQLLFFLGSGPKPHAPPHSPPQSDLDAESECGEPASATKQDAEGQATGDRLIQPAEEPAEPLPRLRENGKASALETADLYNSMAQGASEPSSFGLHRRSRKPEPG